MNDSKHVLLPPTFLSARLLFSESFSSPSIALMRVEKTTRTSSDFMLNRELLQRRRVVEESTKNLSRHWLDENFA